MISRIRALRATVATVAIAAGATLAVPPPTLDASTCGNGVLLCSVTQSCVWVGWAKICTDVYTYYPPYGGGDEPGDDLEPDPCASECSACHCPPEFKDGG